MKRYAKTDDESRATKEITQRFMSKSVVNMTGYSLPYATGLFTLLFEYCI